MFTVVLPPYSVRPVIRLINPSLSGSTVSIARSYSRWNLAARDCEDHRSSPLSMPPVGDNCPKIEEDPLSKIKSNRL